MQGWSTLRELLAATCIISLALMLCLLTPNPVSAQQDSSGFAISMPVEYVNYTIVSVNGTLWAKIDGTYPMHISGDVPDALPMVYPTPPQTTNISITLTAKNYHGVTTRKRIRLPCITPRLAIGQWLRQQ